MPLAVALALLLGVSLGLLGGGGSILAVPVLVYAAGLDPRRASLRPGFGAFVFFVALFTLGRQLSSVHPNNARSPMSSSSFVSTLKSWFSAGGDPSPGSPRARPIDGAEARRLVGEGATLLDVRSAGEFAGGHAPGARNVPVDRLDGALASLPGDRPVVVYCASGMRSARAAAQLAGAGFDVRDLGRLDAWNR